MTLTVSHAYWLNDEWQVCSSDECPDKADFILTARNPQSGEEIILLSCRQHLSDVMADITNLMLSAA